MSYCDDCIIVDICGKDVCCCDAMTFCADKNKFIYVSILDKIRAEIADQTLGTNPYKNEGLYEAIHIIDKYRAESEEK